MNANIQEAILEDDTLTDVRYICKSSELITEALQKGFDVAQMPNGDVIVTEVKIVNVQYSWHKDKNRMIKSSSMLKS